MSEKRFIKKDYDYDGCFFFDREQEFTDNVNKIPFEDVENLIPMTDEQVVELLNQLSEEKVKNEQLRKELDRYKVVILQFVLLLVENGIMDSSVKEEVDGLLEELSGDGV